MTIDNGMRLNYWEPRVQSRFEMYALVNRIDHLDVDMRGAALKWSLVDRVFYDKSGEIPCHRSVSQIDTDSCVITDGGPRLPLTSARTLRLRESKIGRLRVSSSSIDRFGIDDVSKNGGPSLFVAAIFFSLKILGSIAGRAVRISFPPVTDSSLRCAV